MNTTEAISIQLTEKAVKQILSLNGGDSSKSLRIFVEAGGCSGLQYGMEIAPRKEGDLEIQSNSGRLFVDEASSTYLNGCAIDYADGLAYTGFRIQNPNAKTTCGCGTSFEA
jgi:iron-sulfur cluster assembly accessory protein